jgi:hypothetical protein
MTFEAETIVLIAALPPSRARAGLTALSLIKTLSQLHNIICVVDDTGPTPTPIHGGDVDSISFMRIRDFKRGNHPYGEAPRLFILDEGFDSLFALELFCEIGGVVLPVSASMHQSLRALMEEKPAWPVNYATLLGSHHGTIDVLAGKGFEIMGALMDFKRSARAVSSEIPALDFLHQAHTVLAPTAKAEAHLKACGIPATRYTLPIIGAEGEISQKMARAQLGLKFRGLFIIAVSTEADQKRVEAALKNATGIKQDTHVINIMASSCPFMAIFSSNVAVMLDANNGALVSTFADTATAAGLPVITTATNLHIEHRANHTSYIPHSEALHALALNLVEAINHQSTHELTKSDATSPEAISDSMVETDPVAALIRLLSKHSYSAYTLPSQTPHIYSNGNQAKFDSINPKSLEGSAVFIGAVPGAMMLSSIAPMVDSITAAKIISGDTANSLERLLALPREMAVARFGYETPVLTETSADNNRCNNWSYKELINSIKKTDHMLACHPQAASSNIPDLLDFTGLKHQLILSSDPGISEDERWNFSKSQGLAWRLDTHRRSLQVILITGGYDIKFSWASITEQNMKTTAVISNEHDTRMLSSTPVALKSNPDGILDFRITISGNFETGPLTAEEALQYIRRNPLMLEWAKLSSIPNLVPEQSKDKDSSNNEHHAGKTQHTKNKDTSMMMDHKSGNQPVTNPNDNDTVALPPSLRPDTRLTSAAIEYADILLEAQRQQFKSHIKALTENGATRTPENTAQITPTTNLYAEGDMFMGAGWSGLARTNDGTHYRWMQRIASLLIMCDQETPKQICVHGYGIARQRFLGNLNVYINNQKIEGKAKRTGIRSWCFEGTIPSIKSDDNIHGYQVLRFENKGAARLKKDRDYSELNQPVPTKDHKDLWFGEDGGHVFASLGISTIQILDL